MQNLITPMTLPTYGLERYQEALRTRKEQTEKQIEARRQARISLTRQRAAKILREYITKGFVLNDNKTPGFSLYVYHPNRES